MSEPNQPPSDLANVPELIPARMLNEYAYCSRLGYLMWSMSEFRQTLDTLEGTFAHRHVDRPTRADFHAPDRSGHDDDLLIQRHLLNRPPEQRQDHQATNDEPIPPPPESLHARSILLSSPQLGLIARLDLLELEGNHTTPVDYKRGSVPDVSGGVWEPEKIQICAQGLILRENGFTCDAGIIYFVKSRRRVRVPLTDNLIERTLALLQEFRDTCAAGKIPPPLVDSPKCPRCALVSICLPDETNLLADLKIHETPGNLAPDAVADSDSTDHHASDQGDQPIRRLLPARDDALPMYVQTQGAYVSKDGERLVVKKDRKPIKSVKLKDVSQLALFGNIQISSSALRELATRGIPLCHFSSGGYFYAQTHGLSHKNIEVRIAQFACAADPQQSLPLARAFVVGKIKNARTLLRRHTNADRKPDLRRLADLAQDAAHATSAESLLGIEGMAAKIYFAGFASILKQDGLGTFDLNGRNRRPPRDPVNAVLSFVYAILVKDLTVTLQAVGLDSMLGFYHRPRYGRPSLALDLTEEFRPLIGDSTVMTLINNGELSAKSFLRQAGTVELTEAGRRSVLAAYERRMEHEVTHPIFGYRISYRRVLEVQARLLSRVLLNEIPAYPAFITR